MERHRHYMIVMDRYGVFHKAEPVAYAEVGAEVEYKPIQNGRFHRFLLTGKTVNRRTKVAVMTVLVMLITLPLYAWYNGDKVYAYVNVDINPSVEMEVDEAMKVKSIRPLNEDAEQILIEIGSSWENKTVEEVTTLLIEQGKKDRLIDGENVVLIGVSYLDGQKKEKHITDTLDQFFNQHPQEELSVATFEVPEKIREAARSERKSMNELFAEQVDKQVEPDTEALQIDDQEKELIQSYYNKDDHEEKADERDSTDTSTNHSDNSAEASDGSDDFQSDTVKQTAFKQNENNDLAVKPDNGKHVDSQEQAESHQSNTPEALNKKTNKQGMKRQKESTQKHRMNNKNKPEHSIQHTPAGHPNKPAGHPNKKNNKRPDRKKQSDHQQVKHDKNNHSPGHGNGNKNRNGQRHGHH